MKREREHGASYSLPDRGTAIFFEDGWAATWAVDPDGGTWPWLIAPGGDGEVAGCRCRDCAPHEQNGRPPGRYDLARCGAPAKTTGKPCRKRTRAAGERCADHRGAPSSVEERKGS